MREIWEKSLRADLKGACGAASEVFGETESEPWNAKFRFATRFSACKDLVLLGFVSGISNGLTQWNASSWPGR